MAPKAAAAKKAAPSKAIEGVVEEPGQSMMVASAAIAQPPAQALTPIQLLNSALERGASMETIERMVALVERWEANEARKAYTDAMVAFKAEQVRIGKNKHVAFETSKGITEYDHAELFDVTDAVIPALARHGFSHSWKVKQDGLTSITIGCVLTHRMGHSEPAVEMTAGPDTSGGKNSIQGIASSKTYLERYTLLAATGLATGGAIPGPSTDDDGHASGPPMDPTVKRWEDMTPEEQTIHRKAQCDDAAERHAAAVRLIKDKLAAYDADGDKDHLYTVAEAWREIPQRDQLALWLAPKKGGVLTTHERELIKNNLPAA